MSDRALFRFKSPDYERTAIRAGAVVKVEPERIISLGMHEIEGVREGTYAIVRLEEATDE